MISKTNFVLFSLLFLVSISVSISSADGAIFLKIEGIDGESQTSLGECSDKCIDLDSVQFGAGREISSSGGSGARDASNPSLSEITVTKLMDISSVPIFLESLTGGQKSVEILLVETGSSGPEVFAHYKLQNTLVSSYSLSSDGDRPSESISFNYVKIETIVTPFDSSGKPLSPFEVCYDISTAKLCGASPPPPTPTDSDGDGVPDTSDNCLTAANTDQLDTDEDGAGDVCDVDDDNDGISDELDTETEIPPTVFDFTDETTFGTITSGNQFLTITDIPTNGVAIVSTGDSTIDVCGITTLTLTEGNSVDLECGSVIIQVISGSVQLQSLGEPELTLNEGANITIEDTFEITNNGPLAIILVNDVERLISSGETIALGTSDPPDSVLTQILNQIQAILASILGLDERVSELENKIVVFEELFTDPALEKSNKAQNKADNAQQKADETGKEKDQKKADKEQSKACDKIQKEIDKLEDKGLSLPTELQQLLSDNCS